MGHPTRESSLFVCAVGTPSLLLIGLGVWHHEMWRDEAHTWLVVRSASSLADLVERLTNSGHPPTWYMLVYGLRQLVDSPLVLQVLAAACGWAAILLFAWAAPFSRLQKLLFAVGFFPLYQYSMVARPYGLMMLLLFAYCVAQRRLDRDPWPAALSLVALSLTHFFGAMFAGIAVSAEGMRLVRSGRARGRHLTSGILVIAGIGCSLGFVLASEGTLGFFRPELPIALMTFSSGFLPRFEVHAWPIQMAGLVLWCLSWPCLLKRPHALTYYALWTASLAGFSMLVYQGHVWHHGLYFVVFLAALWIGAGSRPLQAGPASAFLTVLLAAHAFMGVTAWGYDLARPISDGRAVAQLIRSRDDLAPLPLIGVRAVGSARSGPYTFEIDRLQSTLVYIPNARAFDPRSGAYEPYWDRYDDPQYYRRRDLPEMQSALEGIARGLQSDLLLVVDRPPDRDLELPHPLEKVQDFPPATDYGETLSIFVYRYPH